MIRMIAVAALLIPSACTSTTDVAPMGKDTSTVGSATHVYVVSPAEMTALSARKAADHCTALGKEMSPIDAQNSGLYGITDTISTFTFQCLKANDPRYQQPASNTKLKLQ